MVSRGDKYWPVEKRRKEKEKRQDSEKKEGIVADVFEDETKI